MTTRVTSVSRRALLIAGGASFAGLAGCVGDDSPDDDPEEAVDPDAWLRTGMEDVVTGEPVVLGDFDRPVMLKAFAVWCRTCDAAEERTAAFLAERDDVSVVSMNIDSNESGDAVRAHVEANGYDWHFIVPPDDVLVSLRQTFDRGFITAPPTVPKALICPDEQFRRMPGGILEPDELAAEFDRGC